MYNNTADYIDNPNDDIRLLISRGWNYKFAPKQETMPNNFIKQVLPGYTAKGTLTGRQTSSIKEVGEKPNTIKIKQPLTMVYRIIILIALILSWLYLLIQSIKL